MSQRRARSIDSTATPPKTTNDRDTCVTRWGAYRPSANLVGDVRRLQGANKKLPTAKRMVLVGNKISPGNPSTKPDGTVVRTLWGELAWQLGGKNAYARIKRALAGMSLLPTT